MGKPSEYNTCYVYAHIRHDTNTPFYIGIGSKTNYRRAFEKKGRNLIWRRVVSKTNCSSNILFDGLSWEECCEIEKTLISHFGRIDKKTGTLVNMTDGGDGASGAIFSEERRNKISNALKGKKTSEIHKQKCRNRRQTEETKNKIRALKTGLKASEATRQKMREAHSKIINPSIEKISKLVLHTQYGIIYNSVRDAAMSNGVTPSYLSAMLRGRFKNKTNLIFA